MNLAYFDCFSGISGAMILGAFLDLGLPQKLLRETLSCLPLPDLKFRVKREERAHITGYTVQVGCGKSHPKVRTFKSIQTLLKKSTLPPAVKDDSLRIFTRLAEVESKIHGLPREEVHFHEIGALDTIVDVVGASLALHHFAIQEVYASPVPVNRGWVQGGHGRLPLPAPAALALLQGATIIADPSEQELVTPTGAAVLAHFARAYGSPPAMRLTKVGYGLGQIRLEDRPNALRIWLGEKPEGFHQESLIVLETNIDDMNPQWYDPVLDRLFQAGAMDCLLIPCQMKKNRPSVLLQVLAKPEDRHILQNILLRETTTLGVRSYPVSRIALERTSRTVSTPWGPVRVKQVMRPGPAGEQALKDFSIEYEDLKTLSVRRQKPLKELESSLRAWILGRKSILE